jgi:hypothetical protein
MLCETNRPLIWTYTIGNLTAGKELVIEGTVTGDGGTDMHIFKSTDTVVSHTDGRQAVVFPLDRPAGDPSIMWGTYPKIASVDGGRFRVVIPAENTVAGNDILFWFTFNATGYIANMLDVTITAAN